MFYEKKILFYIKINNATYHQRNREIALNKAKNYYKNNNERLKKQEKNIETYLKKMRLKKGGNMEIIDIIICLKKRSKK